MFCKNLTLAVALLSTSYMQAADQRYIAPITSQVTAAERLEKVGHEGATFFFTGLSGAGKSTIALNVEKELFNRGYRIKLLDGDNLRTDLCQDLKFSKDARTENIRRAGAVSDLFRQENFVVLSSFIAPIRADRDRLKTRYPNFHEIYVKASVEKCVERDPKGFYKKASEGKIPDYTGLKQSYEEPLNPDLVLDTESSTQDECVQRAVNYILSKIGKAKKEV